MDPSPEADHFFQFIFYGPFQLHTVLAWTKNQTESNRVKVDAVYPTEVGPDDRLALPTNRRMHDPHRKKAT